MEEKEKRKFLAMWNGNRGADRNPTNFQRRDDANHYYGTGGYYEWWYFDCSFDNGYHAVVTYHFRNAFMQPMIPTTQIMIYLPDGKKYQRFAAFKPEECYAGADYCDVRMGNDWIRDMGDYYEAYIKIKDIGLHVRLDKMVPGWKPGTGHLYKDEENRFIQGWVIPVPYAKASGELFVKDEVIKVKGAGYHDHNWGTGRMYDCFEGWYWGRIHSGEYTIDYGWVLPKEKEIPIVSPLLLCKGNEITLSTDMMETKLSNFVRDDKSGKDYAKTLLIATDVKGVKLELKIDSTREIEYFQMPSTTSWNQYYYRFLANFDMQVAIDGKKDHISGEMLHELMFL